MAFLAAALRGGAGKGMKGMMAKKGVSGMLSKAQSGSSSSQPQSTYDPLSATANSPLQTSNTKFPPRI